MALVGDVRGGNSYKKGIAEVLIVSQCHAILRAVSIFGDFDICEKMRRNYGQKPKQISSTVHTTTISLAQFRCNLVPRRNTTPSKSGGNTFVFSHGVYPLYFGSLAKGSIGFPLFLLLLTPFFHARADIDMVDADAMILSNRGGSIAFFHSIHSLRG